ncbi:MAG: right-handed parallel beta-helix repeat-containing protein [Archaeoglobaceae archaeon]
MNKIVVAIILYTFLVPIAGNEVVGNTTKIVEIRDAYFAGDKVVVKTNFEPEKSFIVDPNGEKISLNFTSQNHTFFAEFELNKNVLLGRYTLILDEIQREFVVDFCELNFSYEEGILNLTAKTFFTEPRISYSVGPLQGEGVALVSIPLEAGDHEFVAECGKSVLEGNVSVNFSIVYNGTIFAVLDGKTVNATLKVGDYEFQDYFDPRELDLTKFRVEAEYKHLKTSKEFDLSFGLREVYFPKEKIVIKADFAEKGRLIDPTGKVHELTFKDGVAEFDLSKEIILGEYKVVVGSLERSFFVDSYEISAFFDGEKVRGNVSWHFFAPEFVEVVTKNESFKVELVNGTFEFEIDDDVLIKCGNAEVIVKKKNVELRDYYFLGDTVEIKLNFDAERGKVLAPWGEFLLEFKNRSAEFFANETGMYKVVVEEIAREFIVDSCELNASFDGKRILGEAKCVYKEPMLVYYNVSGVEGFEKVLNGTFEIEIDLPPGLHNATLKCGNSQISFDFSIFEKEEFEITTKDLYFLGDEVEIALPFIPENAVLITPSKSLELNFTKINESYVTRFVVEEIGEHRVEIGNATKSFLVDSCELNATRFGEKIVGKVSWHFVKPEFVELRTAVSEGKAKVNESGEIEIHIDEGWEFLELKCRNSVLKLIDRRVFVGDVFFVGEEVEVVANFRPESGYVIFENQTTLLEFSETNGSFVHKFIADKPGVYEFRIDEFEKRIFVDSCELSAKIVDKKIVGKASTSFTPLSYVEFLVHPLELYGNVEVKNGSFEILLPENASEVVLTCKNSVLALKMQISDFKSFSFGKFVFNVSIDKGKFEALDFDGENVTLIISNLKNGEDVNVTVELPFEIPKGMHVYYWKDFDGKPIAVNYTIGDDRRKIVFTLKDGEIDEDGVANGRIVDPIKIYFPKFKVEKKLEGKKGLLRVEKDEAFEIGIESSGKIKYLAFVDAENLPSKPAEFPYGLLKFEIEVEPGKEAEIRINYPSLEDLIGDEGKVTFYKFNPKTLEWKSFDAEVEGNSVILRFQDGGFGDEDGVVNGVISDDGGVGWVGYRGTYGAGIRSTSPSSPHVYWLYVPSGDSFTITVNLSDTGINLYVYNTTGQLIYSNTSLPTGTSYHTINTGNDFGWWRIVMSRTAAPWRYYGLNVTGADEINLRVNTTQIDNVGYYGMNNSFILHNNSNSVSRYRDFYVFGCEFSLAVYDPDSGLVINVTSPTGTIYSWTPTGGTWVSASFSGDCGVWRINLTQTNSAGHDDTTYGNRFRLAVNLSEGLYFKPPQLLRINGRVLHDLYPLGRNENEDLPIRGVEVFLVEDLNGNGIPDNGDRILRRNLTDLNGNFSFLAVKDITRTYFVVVNSKSIDATNVSLSYNPNFNIAHIWAEQSYQSYENNYALVIPFFGGRNAERSDNVSVSGNTFQGWAEHYVTINSTTYQNETLYFGFNISLVVNGIDEDADTENPRFCQGCLRQFIANANAIQGKQRSYFVVMSALTYEDEYGKWRLIKLDPSLGTLEITEALELNAATLNQDMTITDDNPAFVTYSYETKSLITVTTQIEIPVGVGEDGIPFSGDEAKLKAIPRPEIEIYGGSLNPIFNVTSFANNVEFRNFAIFGSSYTYPGAIRVYGNDFIAENIFAGLRANGTDPKLNGLNRTGGANFWIEGNNSTVRNSIVAFAERYGLLFYTSNVRLGKAENVIGFRNGLIYDVGDNLGAESSASNVTFANCVSAKASANGIESHIALQGIFVFDCTVENNGIGNETGYISEIAGVRINANNSLVTRSLIRENGIGVLVSNSGKQVFNVTITKNSIYNNSKLGIDLANGNDFAFRGDNVTLNDGILNCSQPNCGMDYPVISYAEFDESEEKLYVEGFIGDESLGGSAAFANSRVEIYLVRNSTAGDNLIGNNWTLNSPLQKHYGEGFVYLGELFANSNGNFSGELSVSGKGVELNSLITAIATLNGNTSEFGPNYFLKKKLNLSAEITVKEMNATIKVKAFEKARNVNVYWFKPNGIEINSMSGDYSANGSFGNFYWWKFGSINVNEEKFVYLNLIGVGCFSLSDVLNIGIDP